MPERSSTKESAGERRSDVTDATLQKLAEFRNLPGWNKKPVVPRGLYLIPNQDVQLSYVEYLSDGCRSRDYEGTHVRPAGEALEVTQINQTPYGISFSTRDGTVAVKPGGLPELGRFEQAPISPERNAFNLHAHEQLVARLGEAPLLTLTDLSCLSEEGSDVVLSAADPILDAIDIGGDDSRLPRMAFDSCDVDRLSIWRDEAGTIQAAFTRPHSDRPPLVRRLESIEFSEEKPCGDHLVTALSDTARTLLALEQHLGPHHAETQKALGTLAHLLASDTPVRYMAATRSAFVGSIQDEQVTHVGIDVSEHYFYRGYLCATAARRFGNMTWLIDKDHDVGTPLAAGGLFEVADPDRHTSHVHFITETAA